MLSPSWEEEHPLALTALPPAQESETFPHLYPQAMAMRAFRYGHEMLATLCYTHILHSDPPSTAWKLRAQDHKAEMLNNMSISLSKNQQIINPFSPSLKSPAGSTTRTS
jgi:hypothetical protein